MLILVELIMNPFIVKLKVRDIGLRLLVIHMLHAFIHELSLFCLSFSSVKHKAILVPWLNSLLPTFSLPTNINDNELRLGLSNGNILC